MSLFKKKPLQKDAIDKIKKEELDFSSMFVAINNRTEIEQLFKSLSRRCHPDRFVDEPKKWAIAEDLFKRIMANSTNLNEMKKIEKIITKELES